MFKTKIATLTLAATLLTTGLTPIVSHADTKGEGSTTASFTVDKGDGRLTLDRVPNMAFNSVQLSDLVANESTSTNLKMGAKSAEPTANQLKITDSREDEGGSWALSARMSHFSDSKQTITARNIDLGKLTYDGTEPIQTDNPIPTGNQDSVILTNNTENAAAAAKAGEIISLGTDTKLTLGRSSGLNADTEGGFTATVTWTLTDSIS